MNEVSSKIIELYKATFTLEKLKEDLFSYLDKNPMGWFIKNDFGYVMDVQFEYSEDYESITVSRDDDITIIDYISFLNHGWPIQFRIIVGIGRFVKDEKTGIYTVGKCLANIRYNDDLKTFDVEFYKTKLNSEKKSQ